MAKFIKGITVFLTLPIRLVFPRGTALRTKMPVKAAQKVVCPSYLQGYLYFMAFFLAFFVIATNVFNMLIQGYRAWQLANNHFYSQTPKQDFIDFIKRGQWLSNPLTEQTTTKIDL